MSYKHIGRIKNNNRKVIVAYRTVPGEPDNCIVVTTQNLMADEHDTLMKCVESDAGQSANEFAEAMARSQLPDGRNMLAAFHTTGKMIKVKTSEVQMTPDRVTSIGLDELNRVIAEQRGVSVEDLSIHNPSGANTTKEPVVEPASIAPDTLSDAINTTESTGVLTDEQLAEKYRRDATQMSREAKRLREEAEKLSPSKKRVTKNAKPTSQTRKVTKTKGPVESDI